MKDKYIHHDSGSDYTGNGSLKKPFKTLLGAACPTRSMLIARAAAKAANGAKYYVKRLNFLNRRKNIKEN